MEESKKKILVVDDEPDILTLITARLEQKGYQVLVAADGLEGLDAAEKEKPDLILVDVSMPRMNGFQMVQLLRMEDTLKEIPIIVITASRQKDEAAWRQQAGVDQFILKPFEAEELLAKVEEAFRSHTPRKAA
ncbi:MAG: response regulator [Candidatus Omnitrophica bacterium]|nr:response regulator [Candidatus Omnitrophota bacterium]